MKCRKIYGILISILLLFCIEMPVQAEDLPFALKAQYLQNEKEILVHVIAKEPVVLEAFTFSVIFDNHIYKLHEGYDAIENGYGYGDEFRTQHSSGMMLSNALDDRVMFSGVNNIQEQTAYQGTIATVALLQYSSVYNENLDIRLEFSVLQMNGEAVTFDSQNSILFCEILTETNKTDFIEPTESMETPSDMADTGQEQTVMQEQNTIEEKPLPSNAVSDIPMVSSLPSETKESADYSNNESEDDVTKTSIEHMESRSEADQSGTIVLQASTAESISNKDKTTSTENMKSPSKDGQKHLPKFFLMGSIIVCAGSGIVLGVLYYKRTKKGVK